MSRYYSEPNIPRGAVRPKSCDWAEGDIAYLKRIDQFTQKQIELLELDKEYPLHTAATNHPVIILQKGNPTSKGQFYLVCTVSAYSSGPENNYLAPWKQFVHYAKNPESFRSFAGSEIYQPRGKAQEAALQLKQGQRMPKPKTSWVYTKHAWIVPESVLGPFKGSPYQLEMTKESHNDLLAHMQRSCHYLKKRLEDPRMFGGAGIVTPRTPPRSPTRSPRKPRSSPRKFVPAPAPTPKIVTAVPATTCSWSRVAAAPAIPSKATSNETKVFKKLNRAMAIVN
jgi:hypothetical protein